ncbi:ABC transporter permease [Solicola sp. PLA-1-18]|uniref:ABC transporter permease n=1 Tax=Solicola sp. PLA-1-18 TaxID=3380532 RepID=UPI003B792BBB
MSGLRTRPLVEPDVPSAGEVLAAPRPRRRSVLGRVLASAGPPLALVVVLSAGWQLMTIRLDSPLVPGLPEIWDAFVRIAQSGLLWQSLEVTLLRVALGFALAFVIAVAVGIAMGRNVWVRRFLEPLVLLGLVVPGLVKALLGVIWFGISLVNPVLVVAMAAAPALIINLTQGVRSVDPALLEMAHVYRFSRRTRLRRLWVPALAPGLFAGARLGVALSWKVIVLVEIFGLADGVGYQLNLEFTQHHVAGVLAWTIAFAGVMTLIEYGVLQTLERRSARWRREVSV